jgi:hypothetical protein
MNAYIELWDNLILIRHIVMAGALLFLLLFVAGCDMLRDLGP